MVEANITTYIGQCNDAEHYYCRINDKAIEKEIPNLHSNVSACGNNELFKTLKTERDILALKNKGCYYKHWCDRMDRLKTKTVIEYFNRIK